MTDRQGDKPQQTDQEALQESVQSAIAAPPEPVMIHEIIRQDGERELQRSIGALAWSGLAAGLSMGFSFLMMTVIRADLPDQPWHAMVDGFGYSIGFLIVVLGRQQLFTESTLTAVLPVLTRRDTASFFSMLRLWAVVLFSNIVGTVLFAVLLTMPDLFPENVTGLLTTVATDALHDAFWPMMTKAVLAGWLIALMVWLLPSAGPSRLLLIVIITYVVSIGHFPHLIAGSVEAAFLVVSHQIDAAAYVTRFFLPTFLGNVIGGVSLVALLNHAPVREELKKS